MKQLVKLKTPNGYRTHGNIQQGQYGPRLGLKVTQELRDLVNGAQPDSWLNFSIFDDAPRERSKGEEASPSRAPDEDSIPW